MTHFFCLMCFSSVAAYCGTNYLWYLWKNILQFMYVFFWRSIQGVSIFVVLDNIALNHNSLVLLVGMKNSTITLEDIFMFFKLTIHLAHDPIILLLGIYKRETKTCPHKRLYMKLHGTRKIYNGQELGTTPKTNNSWIYK